MPQNLTGTGGSIRDAFSQQIIDAFAKGATTPMAGFFRSAGSASLVAPTHVESTIFHHTGRRLAIVGDTRVGVDNHAVSG